METITRHLEASAEADLPPSIWADIVSAADIIIATLFPSGRASLLLVSDERIRILNSNFRGIDEATDILSFPTRDDNAREGFVGELALSWDAVRRQAKVNDNTPLGEAAALIAHGALHLAGYDHPDDEAQAVMDKLTIELCRRAGIEVTNFGH